MSISPVEVINLTGKGCVVLICEHASNHIPAQYKDLGLSPQDQNSHAAWDLGAYALAKTLGRELDAPLIASKVSRLVYDCNRPPNSPSAMPANSELIEVPGNVNLSCAERAARTSEAYDPFCDAVSQVLAARDNDTIVVTVHSFSPVYYGKIRRVELGLLHDSDSRIVDIMLDHATLIPNRVVERNQPYGPSDGVTHSLKKHAISRNMPNVMLEVRNDLLSTENGIATLTDEILTLLGVAIETITMKDKN